MASHLWGMVRVEVFVEVEHIVAAKKSLDTWAVNIVGAGLVLLGACCLFRLLVAATWCLGTLFRWFGRWLPPPR